jgi:hypothetical protein
MAATANAITWTSSFSFTGSIYPTPVSFSWTNLLFNQTGSEVVTLQNLSIATTATVIPLGSIATPRWAFFWNLDPTNYVSIFNGSMGTEFIRLLPASAGGNTFGDPCVLPLGPSVVPYAQANTSACLIAYFIAAA